ncbi:MAG TPA: hypothetical protein VH112_00765 [Acidimicrobiales bacterium]|jgi:cytochrome P450|nr:hypothetical protein [Acidimicrobiales bacterium]
MSETPHEDHDADLDEDPYPAWKRLRDGAPVYHNEEYDFWALSRFHDIEGAQKDGVTFSSARGTVLERMGQDLAATGMMIFLDPPGHTALRTLVSRAFTPRRVGGIQHHVRAICDDLLDCHVEGGGFDDVRATLLRSCRRGSSSLQCRQHRLAGGFS